MAQPIEFKQMSGDQTFPAIDLINNAPFNEAEWQSTFDILQTKAPELIKRLYELYNNKKTINVNQIHNETDFEYIVEDIKTALYKDLDASYHGSIDFYIKHFVFELCRRVRSSLSLSSLSIYGISLFDTSERLHLPKIKISDQHIIPVGVTFTQETADRIISEIEAHNYDSIKEIAEGMRLDIRTQSAWIPVFETINKAATSEDKKNPKLKRHIQGELQRRIWHLCIKVTQQPICTTEPTNSTPNIILEGYIRGPDEHEIIFGASLAIMTIYGIFSGNGGFIIFTGPLACFFLYRAYRAHQHRKNPRICEIYNDGIWFNKYKIFIPKALLSQALHFDTNIIVTAELSEDNLKNTPEIRERLHLHLSRTGEDSYKLSLPLLDESKREEFTNYTPQEVQKEIEQYITKANGSTTK